MFSVTLVESPGVGCQQPPDAKEYEYTALRPCLSLPPREGEGTQEQTAAICAPIWFIPTRGVRHRADFRTVEHNISWLSGPFMPQCIAVKFSASQSPRWGTWRHPRQVDRNHRFIPARAGNTGDRAPRRCCIPVHPRVGGEHADGAESQESVHGSSPRGRGTLANWNRFQHNNRFIPAWAGNTRRRRAEAVRPAVHRRVGGEHHSISARSRFFIGSSPRGRGTLSLQSPALWPGGSSPRGRGTPRAARVGGRRDRFIPAWAGNTSRRPRWWSPGSVHPRVGGEH